VTSSMSSLSLQIVDPVTDPIWRSVVDSFPAAGLFHSPPWIRALADTYGFEIRGCMVFAASGAPVGALAYCEIDDFVGRRIVCAPFSDACDPLFTSIDVWQKLFSVLQSHGLPISLRCLRENRVCENDQIEIVKTACWHRISVDRSLEELWHGISPESRRAIRRSERTALEVRPMEGQRHLAAFHQLHVALRKTKYRLLAQPLRLFEKLEERFQESGNWHSLAASLGPRMIAGTIYLRWRDTLYYKFNASATDALDARPNNRLLWEGMRLAKLLGCRYLDLGPSDTDQPGLVRFKRSFGAEEYEVRFLRWTPPAWEDHPDRRRVLAEFTRHMTDPELPDAIAKEAGSAFYKLFA
jgi:CelD/BcsL family acetyltransferase involved in cellulose biosynthesis